MEKELKFYYTKDGQCPFIDWYHSLDVSIRLRIDKTTDKLKRGLYGDHKPLQKSELWEIRMDFGKGYRIYYYDVEDTVILLVAGSEKKDQKKVIQLANAYFEDLKQRGEI